MARIVLILLAVALTVFAIADWAARSKTWTPGRLNRWLWLAVIILLPIIGPLAWIITGMVTRAEASRSGSAPSGPAIQARPDDDPDAVSDVADRIARRSHRTKPAPPPHAADEPNPPHEPNPPNVADESDKET